jgi:hypothetical protein
LTRTLPIITIRPMHKISTIAALLATIVLFTQTAAAQLVIGDLGVTGFSSAQFAILHANGTSTVHSGLSFGGTTHAILYDPSHPGSFLVGGIGFLGRVTIAGGVATYAPLTNAIGIVSQISFVGLELIVCDSATDQILRVDPDSGAFIPLTSGPQPWGTDLSSACYDPFTGDVFAGGNNGIWRLPAGSATPVAYASSWTGGSSFVSGLAIDPVSHEIVATLLTVNRFVRIDANGVLTNVSPSGSMPGPNAIDVDQNGDFIVAASFGQTYRVPNGGGAPVLIGTAAGAGGAATGVSTVIESFTLSAVPTGSGGLSMGFSAIPTGTVEGFTLASFDVSLPVGAGPIFGFLPDTFTFALVNAFPFAAPGNPIHWTWPESAPTFPAGPFFVAPGTLPAGTVIDLLGLALAPGVILAHAPVVRVTIQ